MKRDEAEKICEKLGAIDEIEKVLKEEQDPKTLMGADLILETFGGNEICFDRECLKPQFIAFLTEQRDRLKREIDEA